eukprot:TRINITY_DN66400_c6_g1_i1.p1 TRINITY_DN66400_c6_g1~~TRINITY_DN66400_c6_g1_i1.p1  ORF type:complete len:447 (-),score=145.76 TRINITY_DN66400_c6_g1_i1:142-1434(-)
MKITFKTIQGRQVRIDIDDGKTIKEAKVQVANHEQILYKLEGLKLVYKGKVLGDNETVTEAGIKENEFVVIVGQPAPKGAPPAELPKEEKKEEPKKEEPKKEEEKKEEPKKEEEKKEDDKKEDKPAEGEKKEEKKDEGSGGAAAGGPAASSEQDATIAQLMEMGGWPKEQVQRALRAAWGDANRAVEYLYGGIPEGLVGPPEGGAGGAGAAAGGGGGGGGGGAAGAGAGGAGGDDGADAEGDIDPQQAAAALAGLGLPPNADPQQMAQLLAQLIQQQQGGGGGESQLVQALRTIPNFETLRQTVNANPTALPGIINTIKSQSPELFNLINANQQEFIGIMRDGLPAAGAGGGAAGGLQGALAAAMGGGGGGGGAPPPGAIQVSPEEHAAIQRLTAMGFSERAAAEAYFACDKNEELAANFLFDAMAEDNN